MNSIKHLIKFLPLILCKNLHAQVPVREEPRHKPVLENSYIRLLDVHLNAGDTTQYHIHATPSVIVFISKSIIGAQLIGKTPVTPNEVTPGNTLFIDYGTNPITHRVYNSGNNIFHVMDIELLKPAPASDSCTLLQQSNIASNINQKLVNVYTLNFDKDQPVNINPGNCAYLVVCISGAVSSANKKIATGEYLFFEPGTAIKLNSQQKNSSCTLLQLK